MEADLPPVLAERALSECARSMRAVGGRSASQKVPGDPFLLKCNGSMAAAIEDTLATLPRSRPLREERRRRKGQESRIAVVAAGKTSELSQEQVRQHLVV
jgi:hypothetical protein